jgi:hypothetical protein
MKATSAKLQIRHADSALAYDAFSDAVFLMSDVKMRSFEDEIV